MTSAVRTEDLGKRYGSTWALRHCTLEIPAGSVTALVGPNGAGKTTLLQLAIGLSLPTVGEVSVLGHEPRSEAGELLPRVGFVAQDHPLHRGFTVAEILRLGRCLNATWDEESARARLARLGIPLDRKAGKLSGGQQAQVALTLALAKRPELLILDEPVASLDPLARREFLAALASYVAEHPVTVILSSHLLADLERICDYLVLLTAAQVQLAEDVDGLLATHRRLTGPRRDGSALPAGHRIVAESHTDRQSTLVVRVDGSIHDPSWQIEELSLEDVVLAYMGGRGAEQANPRPTLGVLR
jgi:ABC-2 type transport system ATP-binding protein